MREIIVAENSSVVRDETPVTGFTKASDLPKKGVSIKATYLGSFTGGDYNSTTHYLKLTHGSLSVKNDDNIVKAVAGNKIGLSGTKILNALLEKVDSGTAIEIKYKGMKSFTTKKGEKAREAQFQLFAGDAPAAVSAVEDKAAVDIF